MAAAAASSPDSPFPLKSMEFGIGSSLMGVASSPLTVSLSSEKRLWSALRWHAEVGRCAEAGVKGDGGDGSKRLKEEDSMLLLRGFDSVACTLSLLSENIENALQGARDLGKPPTLTEILHSREVGEEKEEEGMKNKPMKRKFESSSSSCMDGLGDESDLLGDDHKSPVDVKLKKAKNLAMSMATKGASFARQLKSLKSDMRFVQERCTLLEEQNRRLREGFAKGIRLKDDDLVRLQLETLLSEKSRLANENANLARENECLNQLVMYHQLTTQDLTESYEKAIQEMCSDFSFPIAEEEAKDGGNAGDQRAGMSPIRHIDFVNPLDEYIM